MAEDTRRILAGEKPLPGSENEVRSLPSNFSDWIRDNTERIGRAESGKGSLPYFIRDNRTAVERILNGESKKGWQEVQKPKLSTEEAREMLISLLDAETPYANPKLVRMMIGKDFTDKYSILEVSDREVVVMTSAGKVTVNLRHGPNELYENLEIASDRIRRHGYEIELCEKREDGKGADSFNRTLKRFEEYKVNTKGTKGSIDRNIRDGSKQADVIILKVGEGITLDSLSRGIHDRAIRCQNLEEIIVLRNGLEALYTRKQFRKDSFKIQPDDFK
ncbi:MAG: hypothetical protein HDS10_01705 [Bacteroides sp.]|nr:hypothetical protein [Bacteroides sp.]